MELKSNNHSKHAIGYHIIFCPKYRHKVLIGATYYNSVGHISEDMVKRYIEDQKNHG